MFTKEKKIRPNKYLTKSIKMLKKYIKDSDWLFSTHSVHEFFRFQNKCALELEAIFGENNTFSTSLRNLNLSLNEKGKPETYELVNAFSLMLGIVEGALGNLLMKDTIKKYQIFISSTYLDLKKYRQSAYDIITKEGHFPAGMENFIAISENPLDYIKKVIDGSDYYILIIGQRYGSIIKDTETSFTEMEYEYAKKKKLKIIPLIYIGKPLPKQDKEKTKLLDFIKKVEQENTVSYFENDTQLQLLITQSLNEAIKQHPMPGWVKAKQ